LQALDIGGDMQRLDIGDLADAVAVAPGVAAKNSRKRLAACSPAPAIMRGTAMPSRVATARVSV